MTDKNKSKKKALVIDKSEAAWIVEALEDYKNKVRDKGSESQDKYFTGFQCGLIAALRCRVADLFEEE